MDKYTMKHFFERPNIIPYNIFVKGRTKKCDRFTYKKYNIKIEIRRILVEKFFEGYSILQATVFKVSAWLKVLKVTPW